MLERHRHKQTIPTLDLGFNIIFEQTWQFPDQCADAGEQPQTEKRMLTLGVVSRGM
jgi:hypothetical protein